MDELLKISEAAELLGIGPAALRNWDSNGKIKVVRTVGNHRRVPMSEVHRLKGDVSNGQSVTLAYCRVSTRKQSDNLERQIGRVLTYCNEQGWKAELFQDVGSGLNEKRPGLLRMIDRLYDKDVSRIVIEYQDRLTRFGYGIFSRFCENLNIELHVLNSVESPSFEQELSEDLTALVASYSGRLYGKRGGRKK